MPEESEITHEVTDVWMNLQGHYKEISLDVFRMATYNVILGLPWLQKHNPRIN